MRLEWFANGVMLGYRYDHSPIVWPDGTPAPPDETSTYTQTARPGARAPHVPLPDGRSTLDLFGRGFTLLRLGPNPPDTARIEQAAAQRGVPLTAVTLTEPERARGLSAPARAGAPRRPCGVARRHRARMTLAH